jgi:hypothetical protein
MRITILGMSLLAAIIALPMHAVAVNPTDTDPNAATPQFAKVIDDLPLMPGLQLIEDEDVLFASQGSGRIAETNAIGPVDVEEVYKFYRRSLPHLGWHSTDAHTFVRDNEQLRIDAHANQKITVVQFTIKPIGS